VSITILIGYALGLMICMSIVMAAAWAIQQRSGNSGWVDVVWTFGLGLSAAAVSLLALFDPTRSSDRAVLLTLLVLIWAGRLGWHIVARTNHISDDPRYRQLQQDWGESRRRNMFLLLQAQALLSLPLGLAIVLAAHNPEPLWRVMDIVAVAMFATGLAGSALADLQLKRFKMAEAEGVCDTGLWSWSRHPNYFFECIVWIAYPLLAIEFSGRYGWGFLAIGAPVCMYWLLTRVSGIPPLEAHMLRKYGDAYRRYQAETSPFLPLPPGRTTLI
jgi:steroid 5-alpha reductase family enzyme